ncbi:hypothetical protein ACFL24_01910 [Patescibacteria group bacterium]
MTTALTAQEEIAVKISSEDDFAFDSDSNFPVILISGRWLPKEGEESYHFDGYGPFEVFHADGKKAAVISAIQYIIKQIKKYEKKWIAEFERKCAAGYHSGFIPDDGTIDPGYRVSTCHSFPEKIAISLTHIYYGK